MGIDMNAIAEFIDGGIQYVVPKDKREIRQRPDGVYEVWAKLSAVVSGACERTVLGLDGKQHRVKDYPIDSIVYCNSDVRNAIWFKNTTPLDDEWSAIYED